MASLAAQLTTQFYEWERRGRGWQIAPFSCDLEPTFAPFFGHFTPDGGIIDDGKRPSFWQSVFSGSPSNEVRPANNTNRDRIAYPQSYTSNTLTIYTITLPKNFKQSKERISEFLVMLSYRKSPFSFEIIASGDNIVLQYTTQDTDAIFFHAQVRAFFPDCSIIETDDDLILDLLEQAECTYTVDFGLSEECMRPIASLSGGDHDPYTPLFGLLERIDCEEAVIIQILFSGLENGAWGDSLVRAATDNDGKTSFFLDAPEMPQLAREKASRPLLAATIRAVTISDTMERAASLLEHVAVTLVHMSTSPSNALIPLGGEQYTVNSRLADIVMRETHRVGMLVNVAELATFVHFPNVQSSKLNGNTTTTTAAPTVLTGYSYVLGLNKHQGVERVVSINTEQRLRHLHIMGATGTGKSTLLQSLIMQDVAAGNGLCVLDPHGDLIDTILTHIPKERIRDVVLIDPSDSEYPIGFNMLLAHSDIETELLASDLVAVFRRFSTSWGDQMNSVFANAILAFVQNTRQYHLGDLRRFLIEQPYRTHILSTVSDPEIVYYWQKEFPILKGSSIGSILTRLDSFLRPRVIRNMICQNKSLDFGGLMDSKKIVLVKLSQGLLGTENSYLLGAFIVSKLQQTAMARQAQQIGTRIPFFVYIDEFHHFITPSMAAILSGARKYGVGLILAHQDMAQVQKYDSEVANSVLSNAATRVYFRLGDTDAKRLADGFKGFAPDDMQNLPTGMAIARVNTADAAFNLAVMPFESVSQAEHTQAIINHSRSLYSIPIVPPVVAVSEPVVEKSAVPTPLPAIAASELIPAKPEAPLPPVNTEQPLIQKARPPKPSPVEPMAPKEAVQEREHRYLQTFIKGLAEANGYTVQLEIPTPDGTGQVDVLLQKNGETIAVEISVTTTAEWELHNIQKCLAAGYNRVVVCVTQPAKLTAIKKAITSTLSTAQQSRVEVLMNSDIQSLFAAERQPQTTETIVKGYRVKVKYEPNATRQDLLKSIIAAAKKP